MDAAGGDDRRTDVRRYYDANTWKFLLSGSQKAIHRELWGPGSPTGERPCTTRTPWCSTSWGRTTGGCSTWAAASALPRSTSRTGCRWRWWGLDQPGTGAARGPIRGAGWPAAGHRHFRVADFTQLPPDLADFDLAFAIESFVHADPATAFFREAARVLRPGGALVVIDDVLTGDPADPRLADFRAGWHAPNVVSVDEAAALAADAGLRLVDSRDLSPRQRLRRPRDRVVSAAQPLLRLGRGRSMWADSMVGGDALQRCHLDGVLEYRLLRFVRTPTG